MFIEPSEADLKSMREDKEAKKPPPGASPNGHWHNGEWHDESHEVITDVSDHHPQSIVDGDFTAKMSAHGDFIAKLPTDAELAKYSEDESTNLYLLVSQELDNVRREGNEWVRKGFALNRQAEQTESILESLKLLKQGANFSKKSRAYDPIIERLLQEQKRILNHRGVYK